MQILNTGKYFGSHTNTFQSGGLIITDTVYTHKHVGWHYHENPYFTFLLEGKLFEANKKESYYCSPGTLLFHNWQDAHYNIRHSPFARGLHLELQKEWFAANEINPSSFEGSRLLNNPLIKRIFYSLYTELKADSSSTDAAIQAFAVEAWGKLMRFGNQAKKGGPPSWVKIVKEIIHSRFTENISLKYLSRQAGIHPVYLCSEFQKYFGVSLTDYILGLRIQKSLYLLGNPEYSLTEISYLCGFCDQSHFIRQFKSLKSITPSAYRKQLK